MAPTSEWKKLKTIITGRAAARNLKILDPESLKSIRNIHDKNLLHVAAKHASLGICKYLIESGLEINRQSKKNGHTPLICAILRNDEESKKIVKLLVNSGADMSWTDLCIGRQSHVLFKDRKRFAEMLCLALKKREGSYEEAASHLLAKGWTLDNITYLQHDKITKCALFKNKTLNTNFINLENAIAKGHMQTLKLLLNSVAHLKRILSWLLNDAIKSHAPKYLIIIKLLLDAGAPIQGFMGDENTPLEEALFMCRADTIWMLLHHGAKIENFKAFETFNQLYQMRYGMRSVCPFSPGQQESMRNSLRTLIEHTGVDNNFELIRKFPKDLKSLGSIKIEYLSIVSHFSENPNSIGHYFDLREDDSDDYYRLIYGSYESTDKLIKKCTDELEKMKNTHNEEGVSYRDFLLITIDEMIPFTTNESFMNKIKSESFVNMFPRYSKNLQFKVQMAQEKKLLIKCSIDVLKKCVPLIGSCHQALEKIVYYLNDPYLLGLYWNDFFKES